MKLHLEIFWFSNYFLEYIVLSIFFTKPQVLLFYLFFVPKLFKYISVSIFSFFEQSTFSERLLILFMIGA